MASAVAPSWPLKIPVFPGDTLAAIPSKTKGSTPPTLVMSFDAIVQELGIRSGELLLTPPQTAAILQTSVDQLSTMREVGDGSPFSKLGDGEKAPVRYHVSKLRKWIDGHTFQNTSMVNVSRFAWNPSILDADTPAVVATLARAEAIFEAFNQLLN
jgi:hypothetical protein